MKTLVLWIKIFAHHWDLFIQLVTRDVKLRYRRSFLGYLWSVLNPMSTMLIMWAVFSRMFRFDIPNYPVYLLTGQVLFGYMNEATLTSMASILGNASLLKKTYVPKYIFTVSKVSSSMINLIFSFVALFIVMLITGQRITLYALQMFVPVIQIYFFCLGIGLFLAQATVFFRDIQYIWSVGITLLMYATPIFYPITIMPEKLQLVVKYFNPMYTYITQLRDSLLYNTPIHPELILAGTLWAVLALTLGIWSFRKKQDSFILYI